METIHDSSEAEDSTELPVSRPATEASYNSDQSSSTSGILPPASAPDLSPGVQPRTLDDSSLRFRNRVDQHKMVNFSGEVSRPKVSSSTTSFVTASSPSSSTSTSSSSHEAPAPGNKRMPHLHKLEKKHSSGDLHSRLKTRKLLGVGETDDGDIHRSKLSQILGHSDQLYIRLPYGLRIWQLFTAFWFSVTGLWALILPSHIVDTDSLPEAGRDLISVPGRLYGGAIFSLSLVYWLTLSSQDRDIIRMSLLTSLVYFIIQFVVTSGQFLLSQAELTRHFTLLIIFRGLCVAVPSLYHWLLVQRKYTPIKRSTSNKELDREK